MTSTKTSTGMTTTIVTMAMALTIMASTAAATATPPTQSEDEGETVEYVLGNNNLLINQDILGPGTTPGIGGVFFAGALPTDQFSVVDDMHGPIGYSYEWDHRGVWIWVGVGAASGTVTWTPSGDE